MNKTTFNLSEQAISAIITGALFSLIIVIGGHFIQTDWQGRPASTESSYDSSGRIGSISMNADVDIAGYQCVFGSGHTIDCTGVTLGNLEDSEVPLSQVISNAFEHKDLILAIAVIISATIYFSKKVKLKIVKE